MTSPYVYKERMDLISHLVTVKLGNKFFYTVEFQFRTGAAHKGKTHRLLINISIKPEIYGPQYCDRVRSSTVGR